MRAEQAIVSIALWVAHAALPAAELEITYLGNEGFLLRASEQSVLIDALFGEGIPGYPSIEASQRRTLEEAQPPFDGVDLVLASHYHRDHFNAESVRRFLESSPSARFVSTRQAESALLEIAPQLGPRVESIYPAEGRFEDREIGDIGLRIFNLHHGRGGPVTENLGLLVEICGISILHVGDTEANAEDFRAAGLEGLNPDIGLFPDWILRSRSKREVVEDVVQPRRIVAMHLPSPDAPPSYFYDGAGDLEGVARAIHDGYPEAFVPLETGQSISEPCREP